MSTQIEEFELVERCKRADAIARRLLYENYSRIMYAVCLRYLSDKVMAQDLLHDGFVKIFSSFEKFTYRGEGSLRAWMERVMVNTVLQYLRKNDVFNYTTELDGYENVYEEPQPADVELIPQNILMDFIKELPDGYRIVFNLYTFEEKSHKEIASLLGINEKSSSSQLSRAKALLAKKIKIYINNRNLE